MGLFKLVAVFAVWSAMLIDYTAYGCRCALLGTVCEYVQQASVVLRGTVVSRSRQKGPNEPVSYTMDTLTFYKHPADPRVEYPQEISFTTAGSTAACGVVLRLGEEYLVSLYPDYVGQLTANSCGLLNAWEAVSGEDTLLLEAGCVEEDGCSGTCNEEHQACILYEGGHTCADVTCDPSPCSEDEYCSLEKWDCTDEPCPALAVCRDTCNGKCADGETCVLNKDVVCAKAPCPPVPECVKDPCAGNCEEFQKCIPFAGEPEQSLLRPAEKDDSTVWYCADFCDPARCEDNEVCELLPTPCRDSDRPCPMVAVCSETCSGGCDTPQLDAANNVTQPDCTFGALLMDCHATPQISPSMYLVWQNQPKECVFYPGKGYTCAHVTCDPSPCAENETCFVQKSLPPVVICSDSLKQRAP